MVQRYTGAERVFRARPQRTGVRRHVECLLAVRVY